MNTTKYTVRTALCAAGLILSLCAGSCAKSYPAKNKDDLLSFLDSQRITVAQGVSEKQIYIPDEFPDVYESYNELQKEQGFDLRAYRGCEATVYTYDAVSVRGEHTENTQVHIIVYDDKIIGGDVASSAIDGGMCALIEQ